MSRSKAKSVAAQNKPRGGRAKPQLPPPEPAPAGGDPHSGLDLSHIAEGLRPLAFPLADLVPDAGNARAHDDANLTAIAASLRQFGQTQPIIAQAGTRLVRAGHGRLLAAQRLYAAGDLRWAQIAVVFVEWDNVTGVAYAIADNRTAELADWDKSALEKQIREIQIGDADLQAMFSRLAEELELITIPDDEPEEDADDETGQPEIPERYSIVITCADEEHQRQLLEQFETEGLECRAFIV